MKISKLNSPAIAGVVRKRNVKEAIAEIQNLYYDGADMIDLHISCLENPDKKTLEEIISFSPFPVLALNYNVTYDNEDAGFDEEKRVEYFMKAIDAGTDGIDIQGYTFDIKSKDGFFGDDIYSFTKGNPKEIVTDKNIIKKQAVPAPESRA